MMKFRRTNWALWLFIGIMGFGLIATDLFAKSRSSGRSSGGWGSSKKSSSWTKKAAPKKAAPKKKEVKKATPVKQKEAKKSGGYGTSKAKKAAAAGAAGGTAVAAKKKSGGYGQTKASAPSQKKQAKQDKAAFKKLSPQQKTKADQELTKSIGKSGKKFKSRSAAEKDMKGKFAKKTWTKEPASRPSYVPQNVSIGGGRHSVVYVGSGYGYYNPLHPLIFVPLIASQFVVNDALVHSYGYTPRTGIGFVGFLIWVCIIGVVLAVFGIVVRRFT